jgi:MFS transporter, DHA3 family, macrolide efflux protein
MKPHTLSECKKIEYPSQESYQMYLKFWIGQFVSMFGSAVVYFSVIWTMADLIGNNNTLISLAFFFSFLPQVIISPFAGIIADRFDRKKLLYLFDSIQAGLTFLLFILISFLDVQLWQFFLINSLRSVCQAFQNPVGFTLPTIFVPKNKITRINGMNFLFQNIVYIIAGPIAVVLMLIFDLEVILWIDILTFLIALVPLTQLKFPPKKIDETLEINTSVNEDHEIGPKKISMMASFEEGFQTIRDIPGLINVLILATLMNFFFQPFDTLSINFIKFTHGGTEVEYSLFLTFMRIGIFIGAILVSIKKSWKHWILNMSLGFIVSSFSLIAISVVPAGQFVGLYISVFFIMLLNPIINTLFQSLIQLKIPPEKMGRVISLIITITSLMSPLGIIIAGPIADSLDPIAFSGINFSLDPIQIVILACALLSMVFTIVLLYRPKVLALLREGKRLSLASTETLQSQIDEKSFLMNPNDAEENEISVEA